ncbi:hypothetical protein GCM10010917_15910 [Paenibacillus physcomitrellae]|uniref:Uncharacterized protein n=1 Tax=Paenibacillus physcomitrellae TaxID=1619311 RepID=A0ABQ1FV29_9BACL|nr:hypothetical protein GCM10010917_15910 [Paenibacillus physcomitrellae]
MEAKEKEGDLILTHHDARDFIYGMKEECVRRLKEYEIAHYYDEAASFYIVNYGTCTVRRML